MDPSPSPPNNHTVKSRAGLISAWLHGLLSFLLSSLQLCSYSPCDGLPSLWRRCVSSCKWHNTDFEIQYEQPERLERRSCHASFILHAYVSLSLLIMSAILCLENESRLALFLRWVPVNEHLRQPCRLSASWGNCIMQHFFKDICFQCASLRLSPSRSIFG